MQHATHASCVVACNMPTKIHIETCMQAEENKIIKVASSYSLCVSNLLRREKSRRKAARGARKKRLILIDFIIEKSSYITLTTRGCFTKTKIDFKLDLTMVGHSCH